MSRLRDLVGALLCLLGLHDWRLSHDQHIPVFGRPYDVLAEICTRPGCRGRTDRVRIVPGAWPWVDR